MVAETSDGSGINTLGLTSVGTASAPLNVFVDKFPTAAIIERAGAEAGLRSRPWPMTGPINVRSRDRANRPAVGGWAWFVQTEPILVDSNAVETRLKTTRRTADGIAASGKTW
jgi:hypothetical protein